MQSWQKRKAVLLIYYVYIYNNICYFSQVLLSDKPENENQSNFVSPLEVRNRDGHAILHAAVIEGWDLGVSIAIDYGANVIAKVCQKLHLQGYYII